MVIAALPPAVLAEVPPPDVTASIAATESPVSAAAAPYGSSVPADCDADRTVTAAEQSCGDDTAHGTAVGDEQKLTMKCYAATS